MYTKQITVNAIGADEEIVVQSVCKSIVFGEDESVTGWPTVNWAWRGPDSTDYKTKTAGTKEEFRKPGGQFFSPGERVAYVKTTTGSSTFTQAEQ